MIDVLPFIPNKVTLFVHSAITEYKHHENFKLMHRYKKSTLKENSVIGYCKTISN